jgi:hypothetical protein
LTSLNEIAEMFVNETMENDLILVNSGESKHISNKMIDDDIMMSMPEDFSTFQETYNMNMDFEIESSLDIRRR